MAICVSSFRSLVALRPFPPSDPRKRLALLLVLTASGCGGDLAPEQPAQRLRGIGYRFTAPGDWEVARSGRTVSASSPSGEMLVSVTRFELAAAYRAELDPQVTRELDRTARSLAERLDGEVERSGRRRIAGRRAWTYEFSGLRDDTQRIGFVLVGRREYQLLCRWRAEPGDAGDDSACRLLFRTFRLT